MSELKLTPLTKLVVAGAKLRFGETRWQQPMAAAAGVSASTMQKLVSGAD